jgi:hypothetical protein
MAPAARAEIILSIRPDFAADNNVLSGFCANNLLQKSIAEHRSRSETETETETIVINPSNYFMPKCLPKGDAIFKVYASSTSTSICC